MIKSFQKSELKKLFVPSENTKNGQVTIIGGSSLFHGAPILSLKAASRICDMVFFASPEPSVGKVAERIRSKLMSFIWVPWEDVDAYINKSDAGLIGPGFMRFGSEKTPREKRDYNHHEEGKKSREITKKLLKKFPEKRWVIDAGSLQVMEAGWIPKDAILTPNRKEFQMLFGEKLDGKTAIAEDTPKSSYFLPRTTSSRRRGESPGQAEKSTEDIENNTSGVALDDSPEVERVKEAARRYNCIINSKGIKNIVCSPKKCVEIPGGNAGLVKGGVGDVLAGLTVTLYAKNKAFLAACSASFITKAAADELYRKVGTNYNADDLADKIPEVLHQLAN